MNLARVFKSIVNLPKIMGVRWFTLETKNSFGTALIIVPRKGYFHRDVNTYKEWYGAR